MHFPFSLSVSSPTFPWQSLTHAYFPPPKSSWYPSSPPLHLSTHLVPSRDNIFLSLPLSQAHLESPFMLSHGVGVSSLYTTPLSSTPHAHFEISHYDVEIGMQFTPLKPMITFVSPLVRPKHESTHCVPVGSTKPPSSSLQYSAEKHSSGLVSFALVTKPSVSHSSLLMHVFSSVYTLPPILRHSFHEMHSLLFAPAIAIVLPTLPPALVLHPLAVRH